MLLCAVYMQTYVHVISSDGTLAGGDVLHDHVEGNVRAPCSFLAFSTARVLQGTLLHLSVCIAEGMKKAHRFFSC